MLELIVRSIALAGMALLLSACSRDATPVQAVTEQQPLVVQTHILRSTTWQGRVRAFGRVRAAEEAGLSVDFSGVVKRVLVDEGDRVAQGQLLLELDPRKQQLRVQRANQMVEHARAAMDEARLSLDRRQRLADRETVSQEVLDKARLGLDRAAAAYREATAALLLARRELAESEVVSPVDGVVDRRSVEAGEAVLPGSPLLILQTADSLEVQVWISEGDIGYLHRGAPAKVRLHGLPLSVFEASVESLGFNADPATGNFPVKLVFSQGQLPVRSGMTATVDITGIAYPDALILPEELLVDRGRRRVVFVLRDGRAERVEPVLGAGFSGRLQVLSGLDDGDRLISQPLERVVDGMAVSPAP